MCATSTVNAIQKQIEQIAERNTFEKHKGKPLFIDEMENFKLSTVAKFLGIQVSEDNLHDAFYDIYLTKAIFAIVK